MNATTTTPDTAENAFREAAVLEALGGDRELVSIIARAYVDEAPKLLARLRQAAAVGDTRELQAAAHALHGSVRFFGVKSLSNASQSLETDVRSGNLERAQAALAQLEVEAPRLALQLHDMARLWWRRLALFAQLLIIAVIANHHDQDSRR